MPRQADRLKGMAIGSLFMTLFGAFWMVLALNAASWVWLVACVAVPGSLLLLRALGLLHASRQLREHSGPETPEEAALRRRIGRRFSFIFLAEAGAILIAVNLLAHFGLAPWIVFAIAMIVALHFLPLASLFHFHLYYWTGGVEIALCLLIAALMRAHLESADALFGLTMGLSLWITVVVVMASARRMS